LLNHAADTTSEQENWFALGVTARHEKAVCRMLYQKGYETFVPLYTNRRQYAKRSREFELPLFPGYVFCRFDPVTRLPILTTPGVLQVIGAGRVPVPIEPSEIESLKTAVNAKARLMPLPFWQTGQKGRITYGPLAGVEGVVMNVKDPVRLVLSISLLQRSVLLEIDTDCVSVV
jgi:transcription antitermination factor NusG